MDTRPLCAQPEVVITQRRLQFSAGIRALSRLGDWPVYLCTAPEWSSSDLISNGIRHVEFSGPHPAGLVGTHIHHLAPVSADRSVWHIGYQDVIAIGHLVLTGKLCNERVIAIGGPAVAEPRLIRTQLGANLAQLVESELESPTGQHLISGSVLDGRTAAGPMCFLGRFHQQVSLVPLSDTAAQPRRRWQTLTRSVGQYVSRRAAHIGRGFTTASNGRTVAMLPTEAFERVMPLDILPVPLLRAILVEDTDSAQALGCLELSEDDLALTSFVCPAKQRYGAALRRTLDRIGNDG